MINRIQSLVALAVLCAVSGALAEEDLPIPSQDLVYCTVCHGVQLMGNETIKAPRLSGMETWYVELQMQNYADGLRGTHEGDTFGLDMQPMAAALTDDQIVESAVFTNATRSPAPEATVAGNVDRGEALYRTCAICHGADGKGNEALVSPDLTTTNDWYQVTQLENYRSGARGYHPDDTDGRKMRSAAQSLDDDAIRDIVSYINTLQDK